MCRVWMKFWLMYHIPKEVLDTLILFITEKYGILFFKIQCEIRWNQTKEAPVTCASLKGVAYIVKGEGCSSKWAEKGSLTFPSPSKHEVALFFAPNSTSVSGNGVGGCVWVGGHGSRQNSSKTRSPEEGGRWSKNWQVVNDFIWGTVQL